MTGLAGLSVLAACGDSDSDGGGASSVAQTGDAFVEKEMPGLPPQVLEGAKKEGSLNVYLLVPEFNKELVEAFMEAFPFVEVKATYLNGGPLTAKFLGEVRSGKGIADVAQFSSLSDALSAKKEKAIQRYKVSSESSFDMSAGVEGYIYPVTGELLAICYNPTTVDESKLGTLNQWQGLLDPQWDDASFALGEVLAGGTTQLLNYYLYEKFGTKVWERFANADHGIYPGGNPELQAIISGEHDLAIGVPQSLAVAQLDLGAPVQWANPKDWLASPYVQFISAEAKNVNAAKLFQEFSLTPTAQGIFGRYGGTSYRKGFKVAAKFTKEDWYEPVDTSQYWRYDVADLGAKMPSIAKQWRSIIQ